MNNVSFISSAKLLLAIIEFRAEENSSKLSKFSVLGSLGSLLANLSNSA